MSINKPTCTGLTSNREVLGYVSIGVLILFGLGISGAMLLLTPDELAWALMGGTISGTIFLSALIGAAIVFSLIFISSGIEGGCDDPDRPKDSRLSMNGVVNTITEAFSQASDWIFPYAVEHDRVDMVVKCEHWGSISYHNTDNKVHCNSDLRKSPMFICFFKTKSVCAAALGSRIGATVGAVGGTIAGIAAATAIGCAFVWLCALAILIAFLVAAFTTAASASIGGAIGASVRTDDTAINDKNIVVGDYVTTIGPAIMKTFWENQEILIYRFCNTILVHGGPSRNGEGNSGGPPYSHVDVDTFFGEG